MHERTAEQKNNYFRELTLNLHREGFEVSAEENGLLPVGLEGQRLCQITPSGGVRHWREDITDEQLSEALERVTDIAELTDEYMGQLDAAPFLEVGNSADHYHDIVPSSYYFSPIGTASKFWLLNIFALVAHNHATSSLFGTISGRIYLTCSLSVLLPWAGYGQYIPLLRHPQHSQYSLRPFRDAGDFPVSLPADQ